MKHLARYKFFLVCLVEGHVSENIQQMRVRARGGGGGTKKNLIRGGSAPRFDPLPFYIPLLAEKIPLLYSFH